MFTVPPETWQSNYQQLRLVSPCKPIPFPQNVFYFYPAISFYFVQKHKIFIKQNHLHFSFHFKNQENLRVKKLNSERNKRLEKFWRGARYLQRHRTKVATIRNFPRKPRSNSSKIFSIAPNHLLLDPLRDITPFPSFHFFQKRRKHSVESSPFTNSPSLPPDSILGHRTETSINSTNPEQTLKQYLAGGASNRQGERGVRYVAGTGG